LAEKGNEAGGLFDTAVRYETTETPADALTQAVQKQKAYSLEYLEDLSGPKTT
jgi:hypothetical protein